MSDNDSIISEDIKYSSDDGSDSYDAADDDFEFDEVAKLPVQKFYDLPSPKLGQKQAGYEIKEIVKKISSSISRIHSVSDNGYNDYSADFDDTIAQSNESLLYSNNFEADGLKTILDSSGNHAVISEIRCNSVANLPITTQQNTLRFPGVNLVSLHAEIALEEISKEVVRLRNQQRNLLQERRQIAREKKSRADSRRTQYQIEIRDMRQKLIKSEDGYQSQARQILQIQDSLESVISSKKNIVLDLEMKEEELRDVKERVLELQEKLVKSIASLTTEKCESRAKEVNWISERENFRAAVLRANMLAAVVQQSVEANEKRLSHERDRLPEEHRRLLDEQMSRTKALEGSLLDRESSLKAEETRRFATLERRARESAEDISRSRMRAELELVEDRQRLHDQQQLMLEEKRLAEADVARVRNDLSVLQLDIARRESYLLAETSKLKHLRGEFEASKLAVEPLLHAAAADREEARGILEQAVRIAQDAEDRASGVLLAERGFLRQEQEATQRGIIAEEVRSKYFEARKVLQIEATKLLNSQKELHTEKFRLRSAAIELASQAYEVRHAVGLVAKSRRASSRSVSSSQTDNYLALSVRRDDDCRGLPLYQTNQGTSKIGAPQRRRSIESLNFTNFEINDQKYNIEHKSKICTTHSTDDIDNDEIKVDEIENQNQELQSYVPSSIVLESGTGTPQHSRRHSDDFLQTTNAIDDMGKLNQISLSIERLAEKLSGSLSEQYSDQFSHIDLSADKNQMPYDSIVGIDSIPDDRRHFMPYEKRVFAYPFPVSYTGNIDNCDRYHATDEHFEEYHGRGETSKDNFAFRGDSSKESRAATDQKALTVDNIDNNVSIMINSFQDFENSNLRSSVECASEHANRLSLAASRYGIFR